MNLDASALAIFRCPGCDGTLQAGAAVDGEPEHLTCDRCATAYPIIDGIPRFVSSDNYAASFGFQWNQYARTQLDSRTGFTISRDRVFGVTGWPQDLRGSIVLEVGSGAGRFTEILVDTGAQVFSFDYSSAVVANYGNNRAASNLCLFQADVFRIPLKRDAFERVLCLGMLQHTPYPEAAFRSLVRHVKPGGQLVVDVYAKRLTTLLSWKYLLRPITKRLGQERTYRLTEKAVNALLPLAVALRRVGGKLGARLLPIVEYSHLGLSPELNREWAILDTFDMYSPAHDHPQSLKSVQRWFTEAGFQEIDVRYGPNGVVGRGKRPTRN